MIIRAIWFAAGCIAFLAGIWLLYRKWACKEAVNGKFVRWDSMTPKKDGEQFSPVFEFYLGDDWYSCRSFECFSMKQVKDRYKQGSTYKIFVNPKKPKDMIIERKLYWEDYWVMVLALFCLFMAFVPV